MSSLSPGAARKGPASRRHRAFQQADLGRPDLRWRSVHNPLGQALLWLFFTAARPLVIWQKRLRDRETLRRMPGYMLRDIGMDASEMREEADKPFWQA
jgi:uncharacterized protein YjiS (DUF1127 family)